MGILDGVVEWISEQIMHGLDLINTSVLGALGCGMDTFLRYFPAAETMYDIFTAIGIGLILLMWVWNLFKNYWLGAGFEAEHPVKLTFRAIIFITLTYCAKSIVEIVLKIGGTPYDWILSSELPPLSFADQVFLGVVALFELLLDGLVILADRNVFKMNIAGFADFYGIDIQRFRHDFVLPFSYLASRVMKFSRLLHSSLI